MLKYLLPLLFAFITSLSSIAQANTDTVLILHPTISSIKTISYLYEKNILQSNQGDIHFLGVYHEKETYPYHKSDSFLLANPEIPFSLHAISGKQSSAILFRKNNCSEDFNALFHKSIGAIFLGGPDIHPEIYGEEMHLLTQVSDPERHLMEASFVFHLLGGSQDKKWTALLEEKPDYMVLGICLGMQTMNVGTGGTLIQDIPSEVYKQISREEVLRNQDRAHRNYTFDEPNDSIMLSSYHFHRINFQKNSSFDGLFSKDQSSQPWVLSSHHQAIEKNGKDIKVIAYSTDGKIPEIISHKKYKSVLGVQFHPEHTGLYLEKVEYNIDKDNSINRNAFLLEQNSYQFHIQFWKLVGKLLDDSRKAIPSQQN